MFTIMLMPDVEKFWSLVEQSCGDVYLRGIFEEAKMLTYQHPSDIIPLLI